MNELKNISEGGRIQEHLPDIQNILGEVLWHAVTIDPTIEEVSRQHFDDIVEMIQNNTSQGESSTRFGNGCRFLEVAAYAHITGYLLAQEKDWQVTLSDVSVDTLAHGENFAKKIGLDKSVVRRAAVDFHDLPFETGEFDVVYISAALHHTKRWQTVLHELIRVVAPGGLLILQCEPLKRALCHYKFETNRPEEFRPIEAELDRLAVLRTVAQPYFGSRPEYLFGMIENQKMSIDTMLGIIKESCEIKLLEIDTSICTSEFEEGLLAINRNESDIENYIVSELSHRVSKAKSQMGDIDSSLGFSLPEYSEIVQLAHQVAPLIASLPEPDDAYYKIALGGILGGAAKIVARAVGEKPLSSEQRYLKYHKGIRKGVDISFPPYLSNILEITEDLLPNIQDVSGKILSEYFPSMEWSVGFVEDSETKFISLIDQTGKIVLHSDVRDASFMVLLRVWASPEPSPFRVSLIANDIEVAGFDVFQTESFLLNAFIPDLTECPSLCLKITPVEAHKASPGDAFPVTIGAARIITVKDDA